MGWNSVGSAFVGTAIALPIVTVMGDFALAQDRPSTGSLSFTVENLTQYTLEEYYVSPSSAIGWGSNRLINGPVQPNSETIIVIDDGRRDCLYNVRGSFSNGQEINEFRINLCIHKGTFTYYDDDDDITFENRTSNSVVNLYFTPQIDLIDGYGLLGSLRVAIWSENRCTD